MWVRDCESSGFANLFYSYSIERGEDIRVVSLDTVSDVLLRGMCLLIGEDPGVVVVAMDL